MLPGLVGIENDGDTLEAPEYGTARELAEAHRLLTAPRHAPPGAPALRKQVPFKFPGAIQLTGLGPLSDALVGREEWNSMAVRRERNTVLGPVEEAERFIAGWRARALIAIILAFQDEKRGEREAFADNSYFRLRQQHGEEEFPAGRNPDLPPDRNDAAYA